MKYIKQIAALLLTSLFLCSMSVTAYANEIPDESRKGTITVEMAYDGKSITGGTLTLYRVGRVQEDDGNYRFVKTSDMKDFSGDYNNIGSAKLAEDVAAFVSEHGISAYAAAENTEGKTVFTNMELGLYLLVQTEASDGYKPLQPFLISVPMKEDGHYVYEVNAAGKFEPHPDNPDNPDNPNNPDNPTDSQKPSEPLLPQTGQLNWPIPLLAALGLGLFAAGWLLYFRRKKNSDEK